MEKLSSIVLFGIVNASTLFGSSMLLLKKKRRSICFRVVLWICLVAYFILHEIVTYYNGDKICFLILLPLLEIMVIVVLIILNNEGCFWRNYMIVALAQGCISLALSAMYVFPMLRVYVEDLVAFKPIPLKMAILLLSGCLSVGLLIVVIFFSRLFKKEYEGNGSIYKRIMIGYTIVSVISYYSRWNMIGRIRQGELKSHMFLTLFLFWVICLVFLMNYVPYVYNKSEIASKKRERELLSHMLMESGEHYADLVETNQKLQLLAKEMKNKMPPEMLGETVKLVQFQGNMPLSGKVTLDAVVADYIRKAKQNQILFDVVMEPLPDIGINELDFTVLVDGMLKSAFANFVQKMPSAFIQLSVLYRHGCVVADVAYSCNHRPKSMVDQALFETIIKKYSGSKSVRRLKREIQISFLLPKQTKEE